MSQREFTEKTLALSKLDLSLLQIRFEFVTNWI